jgi:hypothetical protein
MATFPKTAKVRKADTKQPFLEKWNNQYIWVTITLDTRHEPQGDTYPATLRTFYDGKRNYTYLGRRYTLKQFQDVCNRKKNTMNEDRTYLKNQFDRLVKVITELDSEGNFSLERMKSRYEGIMDDSTIYSLWDDIIREKSVGTADSYRIARNRFITDNGHSIDFNMIDSKFIERWRNKMLKDLSVTSVAIYLRSFRVVCRRAIDMGLMKQQDKLFDSKVVNRSNSRKDEYLDVKTMTTLWRLFESVKPRQKRKNTLTPMYKRNAFYSLGLFLFMYLADGLNLADAARLKYDDYYFNNGCKAFKFLRHKTADRNEDSEVIFPILPQLRTIIDRIGNKEERGRYVFPILHLRMKEVIERKLIAQENSNIRDRMKSICEYLNITQRPSPTWCRHSFATNLTHAGVPERYIKSSMGHSLKGDVTSRYIDDYSHEQMISYNTLLLNSDRQEKINKLSGLSDEQLSRLLSLM